MRRRHHGDFTEFAQAVAPQLRQTAYLVCGDWHRAEDLTQIALEKVYLAWRRVERADNPQAYAKRIMLNVYLDRRQLRSSGEVIGLDVRELDRPDAGAGEDAELRLTLWEALMRLPPRTRAVLVLRYWEDQSLESTAEMLDMSLSAVKNAGPRGLARLRELLGTDPSLTMSR
ncbi:SigE family RNA polymerase sigma factor [Embleya sp. NBC_00896]|uniref:SigE family RNA polymerase sigma factor n=1 Tax=Embleya sp. NBC_00896 TaxID=2975961 RepID=UPI002F919C7C|nr:SigE family RNA polymerase sigma factor [Embleya sp. NBC_00896]